jgi:two-component system invasion response regulator UvrY
LQTETPFAYFFLTPFNTSDNPDMETILIADDHQIVRRGTRMIIESFPRKYNFIEAATIVEVIQALSTQQVNYAILDMFLEDGNIFSSLLQTPEYCSKTNILVYSMNSEKIYAKRLMQKGVKGFICKQASIEELEFAIQSLLNGEIYLSPNLKKDLFSPSKAALSQNPVDLLSDRELEVVEYIAMGMGAKEIAWKINLDITTVSTYRRRAFEKMNVHNMIELKDKFLLYKM